MRRIFLHIVSVAVALFYLLSTMGYGVHICSYDGTKSLLLCFGESPCEYLHAHIDENGKVYTHSHTLTTEEIASGYEHGTHSCGEEPCVDCNGDGSSHCGCCGKHEHDDGCCKTIVFVLSHDQLNSEKSQNLVACSALLNLCPHTLAGTASSGKAMFYHIFGKAERHYSPIAEEYREANGLKIQFRV